MEKVRVILLEKNNEESALLRKRSEHFIHVQLADIVIYHPRVLEELSPSDADVFVVNIDLPCDISFFISEMKKKIFPSKILMNCEFVQPDLIFNCLRSGAAGYAEKYADKNKFEQAVLDCDENLSMLPMSIFGIMYAKKIMQEADATVKMIFNLFSKGYLLNEVMVQTGLSEREIKHSIFLSLHR
jgi:DNA-binding NarL/FixJ family response regulator